MTNQEWGCNAGAAPSRMPDSALDERGNIDRGTCVPHTCAHTPHVLWSPSLCQGSASIWSTFPFSYGCLRMNKRA